MAAGILIAMSLLTRRAALGGMTAVPFAAYAQPVDFPDKPLRFVVGFPPGGEPQDRLTT
jgi:hypothetical protein